MRRLLVLAPVVVLVAGCGSDLLGSSCTSGGAAKAQVGANPTCTLAPGNATISVTLCADCLDSSAGCVPEFRSDGSLELAPNVCQAESVPGCSTTADGCNALVRQATCTLTIPSATGTRTMTIVGANNQLITGELVIQPGADTSCTL